MSRNAMNMPKHMARKATSRRNGIGSLALAARAAGASGASGVVDAAIEVTAANSVN